MTTLLTFGVSVGAPVIIQAGFVSPARAAKGEPLMIMAEKLVEPVRVFFSDGSNPTVEAPVLGLDTERGMVVVQVPSAAKGGPMKISAAGVDSPAYMFRVLSSTFVQGTNQVSGRVLAGGTGVADALVALLKPDPCGEMALWDGAVTDASGNFALNGQDGDYLIMVFAPFPASLAPGAMPVTLGPTPVSQDVELIAGTVVTGSVVDAGPGATPIAGALVEFEGAGHEQVFTDASGEFAVRLLPGEWELRFNPPTSDTHAFRETRIDVPDTGALSLGPQALAGGVRIYGTVTRAADGRALSGGRIDVATSDPWVQVDEKPVRGDGTYSVYVPAGANYQLTVRFDRDSFVVDTWTNVTVGATAVQRNFSIPDCASVSGTVREQVNSEPLDEIHVAAFTSAGDWLAQDETCADGSYRLRIPPGPEQYAIAMPAWENNGYAIQVWDGTPDGTPFGCEASPITLFNAGDATGGIDFALRPQAVISGVVTYQESGCTVPIPTYVYVDDGQDHGCWLGAYDANVTSGYQLYGLPPSTVVPWLRACVQAEGMARQCYELVQPPAYTPIVVGESQSVSGIDFCIGGGPTSEVPSLEVAKTGGMIRMTWPASSDLYHDRYTVRGGMTAIPNTPPGQYPVDPRMDVVDSPTLNESFVPLATPYVFFLVTDTGPTGIEGPPGSYDEDFAGSPAAGLLLQPWRRPPTGAGMCEGQLAAWPDLPTERVLPLRPLRDAGRPLPVEARRLTPATP
ncbi:MAG: hypothetical protein KBD01_02605 [Acidobacteria bacterium]|nr:hypothetical protein [Acidobacteriota bacterium]